MPFSWTNILNKEGGQSVRTKLNTAFNSLVSLINPIETNLDNHVSNNDIHFTQSSINHNNILNKGTKTHAQIDDHINDNDIHFLKSSITKEDISGLKITDSPEFADTQITSLGSIFGSVMKSVKSAIEAIQTRINALWVLNGNDAYFGSYGNVGIGGLLSNSKFAVSFTNFDFRIDNTLNEPRITNKVTGTTQYSRGYSIEDAAYSTKIRFAGNWTGQTFNYGFIGPSSTNAFLFFLPNGNVGVNNPNPNEIMDVLGNIRISGVYKVGANAGLTTSFATGDGRTATFTGGILTSLV